MSDLATAVAAHAELFNRSVRSGDWADFIATFTEDAVMRFTNQSAGPFEGREAIAAAYAARPPSDTMTVKAVDELSPDTARVRFSWDQGGTGSMTVRWRDDMVAELTIAFDEG